VVFIVHQAVFLERLLDGLDHALSKTVRLRVTPRSPAVVDHQPCQELIKLSQELIALVSEDLGGRVKHGQYALRGRSSVLRRLFGNRNKLDPIGEVLDHHHDISIAVL
jgi:hypothetical protein